MKNNIHYQLFKKLPDIAFINKLCHLYGIKNFDTNYEFTIRDLEKLNTIENIDNIKYELYEYYLNCKFKKYVENLTEKKSITILRHFLKIINYKVLSREKYSDSRKYLLYNIKNNNITSDDYEFTVNFD